MKIWFDQLSSFIYLFILYCPLLSLLKKKQLNILLDTIIIITYNIQL